jgi:hypothetical protein
MLVCDANPPVLGIPGEPSVTTLSMSDIPEDSRLGLDS